MLLSSVGPIRPPLLERHLRRDPACRAGLHLFRDEDDVPRFKRFLRSTLVLEIPVSLPTDFHEKTEELTLAMEEREPGIGMVCSIVFTAPLG